MEIARRPSRVTGNFSSRRDVKSQAARRIRESRSPWHGVRNNGRRLLWGAMIAATVVSAMSPPMRRAGRRQAESDSRPGLALSPRRRARAADICGRRCRRKRVLAARPEHAEEAVRIPQVARGGPIRRSGPQSRRHPRRAGGLFHRAGQELRQVSRPESRGAAFDRPDAARRARALRVAVWRQGPPDVERGAGGERCVGVGGVVGGIAAVLSHSQRLRGDVPAGAAPFRSRPGDGSAL